MACIRMLYNKLGHTGLVYDALKKSENIRLKINLKKKLHAYRMYLYKILPDTCNITKYYTVMTRIFVRIKIYDGTL